MFRSLMTIIREFCLYLTKVIFMLNTRENYVDIYLGDVEVCLHYNNTIVL